MMEVMQLLLELSSHDIDLMVSIVMEVMQLLLELSSAIKEIKAHLLVLKQTRTEKFKQEWIDGQDVMLALKISKRTLQSLRDTGILPYSRINGKFYYKVADLEKLLESNYSRNLKRDSHD